MSIGTSANKTHDGATLSSLERKISEIISTQSQFEARCAAAQSKLQADYDINSSKILDLTKLQADCDINSARILEITKVQEGNIGSSTVNTTSLLEIKNDTAASLLEIKNNFNDSLKALSSCIEEFKNVQTELSLDVKSSTENI